MDELQQKLNALQEEINLLKSSTTIPFDVGEAFKARIISDVPIVLLSSKTASSENTTAVVSVNFGAQTTGTDTVLGNPDAFLEVAIGGITYYLPAFTA